MVELPYKYSKYRCIRGNTDKHFIITNYNENKERCKQEVSKWGKTEDWRQERKQRAWEKRRISTRIKFTAGKECYTDKNGEKCIKEMYNGKHETKWNSVCEYLVWSC